MDNITPTMKQYMEIKARHKDSILFFRMGDFYEMFFEDAKIASKALSIALTSRDKERKIPMCGVPCHAISQYLPKLVKQGYKVAICEQMEDPSSATGVIKRAVTRIVTPGTAIEDEMLESKANNYIAAVSIKPTKDLFGFSYMDVATGEFRIAEFKGVTELRDEIRRLLPSELVLPEGSSKQYIEELLQGSNPETLNVTSLDGYDFLHAVSMERLIAHFKTSSLDGFGCGEFTEGIEAAGALLHYVKETQKQTLSHVKRCSPYYTDNYLMMDHATRRNLEILQNARTLDKNGTLIELLDQTHTSMGGRKLRTWLTYPIRDIGELKKRHDCVEEFFERRAERKNLEKELKGVFDLERLVGKISLGAAFPRDISAVKESLKRVGVIKKIMEGFDSLKSVEINGSLDCVSEVVELIERGLVDCPPALARDGSFIKEGYSQELDELRNIGSKGKDWLIKLEREERQRTGINSLKVGYNNVFGYYIEVTKANLKNVPPDYIRKQTLVNAERFITPQLKEWEVRIISSEEKAKELESRLFSEMIREISGHTGRMQSTAEGISQLDALISFSSVAEEMDYVKPGMNEGDAISIEDGRHPVIEKNSRDGDGFVPNSTFLDCSTNQIIMLTGPNMAGKSTYIRQAALIVIMAQAGSFVPAKSASIGIVDRIFTRVGASDDISRGQSTFMVEMSETASILNNATRKSLLILDEIGRGTSTFDGISIAWAVVEHIHDNPKLRSKTLFATHYHELTDLSLTKERVKNYNMGIKEWDGKIIFLKKLMSGGASSSYGIHVAELSGLPQDVTERAREILSNLESGEFIEGGVPRLAQRIEGKATARQPSIPDIFSKPAAGLEKDPIREELRKLDIERTTPVEAISFLNRLKEILDK